MRTCQRRAPAAVPCQQALESLRDLHHADVVAMVCDAVVVARLAQSAHGPAARPRSNASCPQQTAEASRHSACSHPDKTVRSDASMTTGCSQLRRPPLGASQQARSHTRTPIHHHHHATEAPPAQRNSKCSLGFQCLSQMLPCLACSHQKAALLQPDHNVFLGGCWPLPQPVDPWRC